jgi:hypothetical protein
MEIFVRARLLSHQGGALLRLGNGRRLSRAVQLLGGVFSAFLRVLDVIITQNGSIYSERSGELGVSLGSDMFPMNR